MDIRCRIWGLALLELPQNDGMYILYNGLMADVLTLSGSGGGGGGTVTSTTTSTTLPLSILRNDTLSKDL